MVLETLSQHVSLSGLVVIETTVSRVVHYHSTQGVCVWSYFVCRSIIRLLLQVHHSFRLCLYLSLSLSLSIAAWRWCTRGYGSGRSCGWVPIKAV